MKGGGVSVKLANASPGVIVVLLGGALMWYSMRDFSVEKKTTIQEADTPQILDQWLTNTTRIKGDENYIRTIDLIVGTEKTDRFKVEYLMVHPPLTLGEVAFKAYGNSKYWKLIAASNIGKSYFDWGTSNSDTKVSDSSLLEVWKVSKYYGKTTEEIIKVSGIDKTDSYHLLMEMAKAQPEYNPLEHMYELSKVFKEKELSLVQTPANYSGDIQSISDLSLKYYGDKTLWPLIVWTNPEELSNIKNAGDKPDQKKTIYILHFLP